MNRNSNKAVSSKQSKKMKRKRIFTGSIAILLVIMMLLGALSPFIFK